MGHVTAWPEGDGFTVVAEIVEGEPDANARLIAAAPDLLAALEKVTGSLRPLGASMTKIEYYRQMDWEVARAAIAKAKGEQDG
jgi:hypothetical protein